MLKRLLIFSFLLLVFLFLDHKVIAHGEGNHSAVIYYNEACGACTVYLREVLEPTLRENGIEEIVWRDYIADQAVRRNLNGLLDKLEISVELQSHIMVIIGNQLILAGHIPYQVIKDSLVADTEKLIIFQDEMTDKPKSYRIWAFEGPIKEYQAEVPLKEYLDWFNENRSTFETIESSKQYDFKTLFPLIALTGFLDGLNPCAFAVLLFFIAFLFSLKKTRLGILTMGITYIVAIYLAYLGIGIGLFRAIQLTGSPHFMAKVGAYLVIILGLINLLGLIFPDFPIRLIIPQFSKKTLSELMYRATVPAAFVLGFLVGLCTFPCSGGPYVAIVSLLSAKVTYFKGLVYLLLYNLMFVTPLIIILALSSNKMIIEKITNLEQAQSKRLHLLGSLVMIALGIIILGFFV